MSGAPTVYEERRAWTPRAIIGTTLCIPGAVACFVGFAYIHRLTVLVLGVICVLGVLNLASGALSKRFVLRADEHGIELHGRGRSASTAQPLPWDEVQGIYMYKPRNIPMIGIVKSLAGVPAEPMDLGGGRSIPKPDFSAALDSWRVDFDRLKSLVGTVAPNVEVVDHR